MIDKILVGKLKKVISDNTLMGQKMDTQPRYHC
jgi:hypothetical protein